MSSPSMPVQMQTTFAPPSSFSVTMWARLPPETTLRAASFSTGMRILSLLPGHPGGGVEEAGHEAAGRDELVAGGAQLVGEREIARRQEALELVEALRADDRRRHAGLLLRPHRREQRRLPAVLAGQRREGVAGLDAGG